MSVGLLGLSFFQMGLAHADDRGVTDGGTIYNSAAERTAAELSDAN